MSEDKIVSTLTKSLRALMWLVVFLILLVVFLIFCLQTNLLKQAPQKDPDSVRITSLPILPEKVNRDSMWHAPDENTIPRGDAGDLIRYGKELVARTSYYLGPKGTVAQLTNAMNCQNCHLEAGTKPLGNNYSAVASTYPKMRARSGMMESIEKRVSDCFERSLNGTAPAADSKEMKAIVAYINWLGTDVPKGVTPIGAGIMELKSLDRAASPENGKLVYETKCKSCHGQDGAGSHGPNGTFIYPPLWGNSSYNNGAGLYRLSRFAGYVKANMPFGTSYAKTQLTDSEVWDVAAFVNSQERPKRDLSKDWPDISKKPFDHPFGPFTDSFSEQQHKLGPYGPIKAAHVVGKKK